MPKIYLNNYQHNWFLFDSSDYFIYPVSENNTTPTKGLFGFTAFENSKSKGDDRAYIFGNLFTMKYNLYIKYTQNSNGTLSLETFSNYDQPQTYNFSFFLFGSITMFLVAALFIFVGTWRRMKRLGIEDEIFTKLYEQELDIHFKGKETRQMKS